MTKRNTPIVQCDGSHTPKLVRTSVLIYDSTDSALRELADTAKRPLSWEIRLALEAWVDQREEKAA
jgi:predicted transcriptional regulator